MWPFTESKSTKQWQKDYEFYSNHAPTPTGKIVVSTCGSCTSDIVQHEVWNYEYWDGMDGGWGRGRDYLFPAFEVFKDDKPLCDICGKKYRLG